MEENFKKETAHSATTSVDTTTVQTLQTGKEYQGSELEQLLIIIAVLGPQRRATKRAMLAKCKSIKTFGQIAPILLVSAVKALNEGLSVQINDKAVTLDHPDIDRIYIPVDGGTRYRAIQHINSTLKKCESPIDPRYLLIDIKKGVSVYDILQEANQSVVKWDKQTHTTSLVAAMKGKSVATDKFDWILCIMDEGCSEAAAYAWANVKSNRVPSKSDIAKAYRDTDTYNKVSNSDRLSQGKELYEAWKKRFSGELIGLKVIPEFIADKVDSEINNNDMTLGQAKDRLILFIEEIPDAAVDELKSVKGSFAQKSVELKTLLSACFAKFETTTLANQSDVKPSKNE